MRKGRLRWLAVAAAMLLVVAACGDDDDTPAPTPAPTTQAPTGTPTEPPAPAGPLRIAIVAPSASNDLAFTQSIVDAVNAIKAERGN
jgi:basic membrane protein A